MYKVFLNCRCKCGALKARTTNSVNVSMQKGLAVSCTKCKNRKNRSEIAVHDYLGKTFGRLTVLGEGVCPDDSKTYGPQIWLYCLCECGQVKNVPGLSLKYGRTSSCGCYREAVRRKPVGEANLQAVFNRYKKRAEQRGIEFVTKELFAELCQKDCFYCGEPPSNSVPNSGGRGVWMYSGLDRVNVDLKTYVNNCVPCCIMCNVSKSNYSLQEFFAWVSKLYIRSIKGQVETVG